MLVLPTRARARMSPIGDTASAPCRYALIVGLFRDMWRAVSASPPHPPVVLIAPSSPGERQAAAEQLAQYFLDHGYEGNKLFEAMVDAEANTGVPISDIDRAYDQLKWVRENPIKVATVDPSSLRVLDLREVPSTRMRIKGSANWVTAEERSAFGGTGYLLVREPNNEHDSCAVAVYGKGRKVGYVSATKAAALAPILDPLQFDAFSVGGTSVIENSIRLWVDMPKLPDLRQFVKLLNL